jgi:class 3 adenylate cyclase
MDPMSVEELAERTEVETAYVRRLIELGALPGDDGGAPYGNRDVHTVRLLRTWEEAGLPPDTVMSAVHQGKLSLSFLETPAWTFPERLDRTYEELAAEEGVALPILRGFHQALGFAPPEPADRASDDDLLMVNLLRMFLAAEVPESAVLRLFRVFADNLRRLVQAQADVYRAEIVTRLRRSGMDEGELMEWGAQFEDISRRHDGLPIRWLGDGGMFHFKEPAAAVLSALEMVEGAPRAGLPPTHIGIHSGPVIFQDGDVYGRTVNIASRIASVAGPGQVLASQETVEHTEDDRVRFELQGPVALKGVAEPVTLYQAFARASD